MLIRILKEYFFVHCDCSSLTFSTNAVEDLSRKHLYGEHKRGVPLSYATEIILFFKVMQ